MKRSICISIAALILLLTACKGTDPENIFTAAEEGNIAAIKRVIESNEIDINMTNDEGQTPLIRSIIAGQTGTSLFLLDNGADPTLSDAKGVTPLMFAASSGDMQILEYLLKDNGDINALDNAGKNALWHALEAGEQNAATALLKAGADYTITSSAGKTLLMLAAGHGLEENAALLLQKGLSINSQTQDHYDALRFAVINNQKSMVVFLLANGAKIHQYAFSSSIPQKATALSEAAKHGNKEIVQTILYHIFSSDYPADFRIRTLKTALEKALSDEAQQETLAILLIENGADFDIIIHEEEFFRASTPFVQAIRFNMSDLISLLLEKGTDVNFFADTFSHTTGRPLKNAAAKGNLPLVKTLLQKGAKLEVYGAHHRGRTALQAASESGHLEVVQFLIEQGADIYNGGVTLELPLFLALQQGQNTVVSYLLEVEALHETSVVKTEDAKSQEELFKKLFLDTPIINQESNWEILFQHDPQKEKYGFGQYRIDIHNEDELTETQKSNLFREMGKYRIKGNTITLMNAFSYSGFSRTLQFSIVDQTSVNINGILYTIKE